MRTGQRFENEVAHGLKRLGYVVVATDVEIRGTMVDLLVEDRQGNNRTLVECKGGKLGLSSADMVKRLVGMASYVRMVAPKCGPLLPITTKLPKRGTVAYEMLDVACYQKLILPAETLDTMARRMNHWSPPPWMTNDTSWYKARNDVKLLHEPFISLVNLPQIDITKITGV